jgi:hypothetical protein
MIEFARKTLETCRGAKKRFSDWGKDNPGRKKVALSVGTALMIAFAPATIFVTKPGQALLASGMQLGSAQMTNGLNLVRANLKGEAGKLGDSFVAGMNLATGDPSKILASSAADYAPAIYDGGHHHRGGHDHS